MEKQIITNKRTGEQYTYVKHPSGLDIMVWKMEGFSGCEALFGTKYGSINTRFKTSDDTEYTSVPEGIAHFLEHKLFENEDCDVFELYAKTGASANAYTSFNQTVYLFECTNNFKESLEILLSFVQKPYFTQATVDKEQGIIGQEIKMCEDSVNRAVFFNLLKALYVNHPINIDIAGTVESISQINADLLYKCYYTFYNLHNMVLAIAGNVDIDEVIEVADRLLIPCEDKQLQTEFLEEPETVAKDEIKVKMSCGTPLFSVGYKLSPKIGVEALKANLISSIMVQLLSDPTSPLYVSMINEGLINSSFAGEVFCGEGYFSILFSGESRNYAEVVKRIKEEIISAKDNGFDEEKFQIIKKCMYGRAIRSFNNVDAVATSMIESKFSGVDPFDNIEILADITLEDVEKFIREEINVENSAISVVEPL